MKNKLFLYLCFAILMGCQKETQLKLSVFNYDPEYPELPAYSEWGYNTFGAYYDRNPFIYSDIQIPVKVINTQNQAAFLFSGSIRSGSSNYNSDSYSYYGNEDLLLKFILKERNFENYSDLVSLHNTKIDLKSPSTIIVLENETISDTLTIISGELFFKRVQHLWVDKQSTETILSGYFEMQALRKGKPITFSEGRFDVGIGKDNFYKY